MNLWLHFYDSLTSGKFMLQARGYSLQWTVRGDSAVKKYVFQALGITFSFALKKFSDGRISTSNTYCCPLMEKGCATECYNLPKFWVFLQMGGLSNTPDL